MSESRWCDEYEEFWTDGYEIFVRNKTFSDEEIHEIFEHMFLVVRKSKADDLEKRIEFLEGIIEEYYNLCDSLVVSFPAFERKAIELFNNAELPAKKEKTK